MSTLVRGCGTRIKSGIYSCSALSSSGYPLEYFLYDPPKPIDPDKLGVTPVGTTLLELGGVHHILDWIGTEYYPNVADFLEEVRRFGLSRRLSSQMDFSKLSTKSCHVVIHARGAIDNWREYMACRDHTIKPWTHQRFDTADFRCPKECVATHPNVRFADQEAAHHIAVSHQGWPENEDVEPTYHPLDLDVIRPCSSLWWEDIEDEPGEFRMLRRYQPSFSYEALRRPEGVRPRYRPAMVARFPITNLAVIANPGNRESESRAVGLAGKAQLPVTLEEE